MSSRCEIGSEFWDVPINESERIFPIDTKWFLSGRSALRAIIEENEFEKVMMPDWCCGSMIKPFVDKGIKIEFYPFFKRDELPIGDITENVAVFIMDYFGYTSQNVERNNKGVIIRDVTHSLFSASYDDADYYFGSLRKWAGFWTGGYAWGLKNEVQYEENMSEYVELRKEAMFDKARYINGDIDEKKYLKIFERAEDELEDVGVLQAHKRDIELAGMLDVNFIREQRRKNARVLLDAFSEIAIFPELSSGDCPMFVPIRVENRDALRKYLIEEEIYCPVHWPKSQYHRVSKESERLYMEELSLVCDQRYTEDDMERVVSAIKSFLRNAK